MSNDLDVMKPIIANALQPEPMGRHAIRTLAMRHGFALRPQEGRDNDLNECVYSFAREVFEAGRQAGSAEINALREDLERERMRLVACGVVAMADTPESAAKAREMHQDYRSASCNDVARRVDECMALRKERDALAAKLAELEGQEPVAYGVMKRGERVWYVCDSKSTAQGYANHCAHRDARGSDQNVVPVYCRPIPAEPVNARLLEFAQEWLARQGTDENYMTAKARAILAEAEARGVTGPKRLTDEEICQIAANSRSVEVERFLPVQFARAIEAAVLGAQETKNGD